MKSIYLISLIFLFLCAAGCTENKNNYREIQINKDLEETRNFFISETKSRHDSFDSERATIIAQKGDPKRINYWHDKSKIVSMRAEKLCAFLGEQEKELLNGDTYSTWKDLENINNLNNKKRSENIFLTPVNGTTKGMIIKDSITRYFKDVLEVALNYKIGLKEYHFNYSRDVINNLDVKEINPEDTAWVLTIISHFLDNIDENLGENWDKLQFKDASVIDCLNVLERFKNYVRKLELDVIDFMLYKSESFISCGIPDIIEYRAIGEAKTISKGKVMEIEIQKVLQDDKDDYEVIYGVNDSNEKNWSTTSGKIKVEGNKIGSNIVYGKIKTLQGGEFRWIPFEYEFNVVE